MGLNELMDVKGLAWSLVQSKGFPRVCHEIGEEGNKASLAGPASCALARLCRGDTGESVVQYTAHTAVFRAVLPGTGVVVLVALRSSF